MFLLIGLKGIRKEGLHKWTNVIYLIVIALVYDNYIIAIGRWIGESSFLESLNLARFWFHALFTPLLVIFSVGTLQESGLKWAQKTWVKAATIIYTLGMIGLELIVETIGIKLIPIQEFDVLRYGTIEEVSGPPLMILFVTLILILCSVVLWVKTKWVLFFIGVFIMTIGSAIPINVESGAVTNAFELFLIFTLIWTKRKLIQNKISIK
ncbi:hypothetical protein [Bacillus sp. FJAT-22090]|uniref:hypothetical protein n=1 Tax=Bacillus sp. FJAT-22090 TaxID=1581038 RepID=UPI0006AFE427|nr:hypothetical protein [Bacillus sp. FJAT-22090]